MNLKLSENDEEIMALQRDVERYLMPTEDPKEITATTLQREYMNGYLDGQKKAYYNCDEIARELSQIKSGCSQWLKDHDKQIRDEVIEEIHKALVEEIKSNPEVIYIDNPDYCCVVRGSVLRVIRDTLEQMKGE